MAKFYSELNQTQRDFISRQHMFFTATAPRDGRINLSPKGMDSLRILGDRQAAYLDVTGSGNETAAHLMENGRMTLMFCSFEENPLILRLYGRGHSVHPHDPQWDALQQHFKALPGARQIIVLDIDSVQTTCGYAVPLFDYQGERETLARWAEKKGEQGIRDYWSEKNQISIDGLPTGLLDE